jgi:hypothetical protein
VVWLRVALSVMLERSESSAERISFAGSLTTQESLQSERRAESVIGHVRDKVAVLDARAACAAGGGL